MAILLVAALICSLIVSLPSPASAAIGDVSAWGVNTYGQLGDGSTTYRTDAVSAGANGTIDLAGGRHHVLAANSDGSLSAWGWNVSGQLGDGTSTNRSTPVTVNLGNVTAVGAGHYHSLAVRNGAVWSWGRNAFGQLGDGTTNNRSTPAIVAGTSNVAMVAGGREHSVALRNNGTMLAWGNNANGQLGNGTNASSTTPVAVNINNVDVITSGRIHSVALRTDGTVWTWGDNSFGQLGDGTTTSRSNPVRVNGLTGIVDVEAFGFHTIALDNAGRVWAWGRNNLGQLGDSTATERTTPVLVGVPTMVAIGSGRDYGMAAQADGTIYAWGRNNGGELGDGTTAIRTTPVVVDDVDDTVELVGGRDYIAVRAGGATPPPPEPELECTATVVGNDLRLDWTNGFGRAAIRRGASWHSTPGQVVTTTISGAAADQATYSVRVRIDGLKTDFPCERDGNPPPPPASPCSVATQGTDAVLSWDPAFTNVNVRRNGSWLRTVNNGTSTTVAGGAGDTFAIIVRINGVKITHPCT